MATRVPVTTYADPADALNKINFQCIVKESYHSVIHRHWLSEDAGEPLDSNPFPEDNCIAMLPIRNIIDMYVNQVEFSIYHREDVLTIKKLLEDYLKFYVNYIPLTTKEEQKIFFDNAKKTYMEFFARSEYYIKKAKQDGKMEYSLVDLIELLG